MFRAQFMSPNENVKKYIYVSRYNTLFKYVVKNKHKVIFKTNDCSSESQAKLNELLHRSYKT